MDASRVSLVRAWARTPRRGYVSALRLRSQRSPHGALAARVAHPRRARG
jgi:hypothetical protein